MTKEIKKQSLGDYIRQKRTTRSLSLLDVAQLSGLHFSYWSRLETDFYQTPSPKHLKTVAETLGVPIADLYRLAGYDIPNRLPAFRPYLRAKYSLPPEAVAQLEQYFEMLRNYYGIPKDKPVYPPKPGQTDKPTAPRRAA